MLVLKNIQTSDDYTQANELADQDADLLDIVVANAAILVSLRPYDPDRQNVRKYGDEFFLAPGAKLYDGVAGVKVRSAVPGQPAQVSAVLFLPDDPRPSSAADVSYLLGADGSVTPVGGAINSLNATLAANVAIPGANVYVDALALALPKGTWFVVAQVQLSSSPATHAFTAKLHDGAGTAFASGEISAATGAIVLTAIVNAPAGLTLHFSVADATGASTISASAPLNSAGNDATLINALQLA